MQGEMERSRLQRYERRRKDRKYVIARMAYGYAQWLARRHRWILWLSFFTFLLGAYYSVQLYRDLRTDMEELLPASAQSVRDVKSAVKRIGGLNHLSVVIETKDSAAGIRFSNDVAEELRKLPPHLVERVQNSIKTERAFFEKNKSLYIDTDDWKSLQTYVRDRIRYERKAKSPFSLGLDDEKTPTFDFDALKKKYESRASDYSRFPDGYFQANNDTVVLAFLPGKVTDQKANDELSRRAHEIVARLQPQKYAPDMVVGFDGDVQNMVEEHEGLTEDLISSSVIVTILVALALLFYFRTFWGVYALCTAVFIGSAWTFGLSYWVVGYLNANTAFMGSIVLGNGINFPIIMAARYFELRRGGIYGVPLLSRSLAYTAQATWTAALAAGVAYASLMLTDFRGFNQFGVIGGMGMVLCWLSGFIVLPAFLFWLEKRGWFKNTVVERRSIISSFTGHLVEKYSVPIVIITLVSVALSVVEVRKVFQAPPGRPNPMLESDFSKLRNKRSLETGSGYWGRKVDAVFKRYLTPTLIAASSEREAKAIAAELRRMQEADGVASPIATVNVVQDFLPKDQSDKIRIIEDIKKQLPPKVIKKLSPEDRKLVAEFLPEQLPKPLSVTDLPDSLIVHFRETDGTIGRLIHVYPKLPDTVQAAPNSANFWDANEVIKFAEELRSSVKNAGVSAIIAGQPPLSADMISAISKDGPQATLVAFLAVMVLVFMVFGRVKVSLQVLSALLLGVLWMVAIMVFRGYKVNFLNFIALPITFGIGVDYAVNVFSRYKQEGGESIARAIRNTGAAVVLCSATTIIGYSSLLIAGSQAFVSFGRLAVMGEITCLVAAIIAFPALLYVFSKKKKGGQQPVRH